MSKVIAVAGKGGVGKTSLSGLLIQYLSENGRDPILAVDADANSNLYEVLGVEPEMTLAEIRDDIESAGDGSKIPLGMDKAIYTEMKLNSSLAEEDYYDLLVMGQTQGEGCYCFVNTLLEKQVQKLQSSYRYVVVDSEAGMEHISRGILPQVDILLLISDSSRRGIQAAGRIAELVEKLDMSPKVMGLIVNRVPDGVLSEGTAEEIQKSGLTLIGIVPKDDNVYKYDCAGRPLVRIPEDSPVKQALKKIATELKL